MSLYLVKPRTGRGQAVSPQVKQSHAGVNRAPVVFDQARIEQYLQVATDR